MGASLARIQLTAVLEKTVLYGIFVVTKGADVTAASVTPILVHPFALITSRKPVKDFQSLLMFAMAVKSFQVLFGDNGSEFSNPSAIERTRIFYCDPQASYQKGAAENNHSLIRRIIHKGTSLGDFNQGDITLMMNHINSYKRLNLGDKSPYEVFASLYGEEILKKMDVELIPPDKVILRPSLLK